LHRYIVAKSAEFRDLPKLAKFVERLDTLLGRLSDERGGALQVESS
jgi:hypothetical protein